MLLAVLPGYGPGSIVFGLQGGGHSAVSTALRVWSPVPVSKCADVHVVL